jgi:hypothetical protein
LFADGKSDHVAGQTEATLMAFGVPSQCKSFNETLSGLTREKLLLAYRTSGTERRREVLMSADRALHRVGAALLAARAELSAALKQMPPEPMFDDVRLVPHPEVPYTGADLTLPSTDSGELVPSSKCELIGLIPSCAVTKPRH